jgi:cyclopropane fatty-acyl-phospholipid synthase-like methyltransferase
MGTDADDIIDLYDRHANAWVRARLRGAQFHERGWLERFCHLVGAGGSVLDIGCGAGEPMATYLVTHGYSVTGVDSSPAMIEFFRERLPDQTAVVADMRTLSLERAFPGILAWDSFFHLNHDDQRRMFAIFRAHAAPRAALMFTSGSAHNEAIGQLEGEPLYHASLDPADYRQLLDGHGFDVVATVLEDQSCGGRAVWLAQRRLS